MTNLDFINKYREIKSVGKLCKLNKICYSNLVAGNSTEENEEKIARLCKQEIIELYHEIVKEKILEDAKTNSL